MCRPRAFGPLSRPEIGVPLRAEPLRLVPAGASGLPKGLAPGSRSGLPAGRRHAGVSGRHMPETRPAIR